MATVLIGRIVGRIVGPILGLTTATAPPVDPPLPVVVLRAVPPRHPKAITRLYSRALGRRL